MLTYGRVQAKNVYLIMGSALKRMVTRFLVNGLVICSDHYSWQSVLHKYYSWYHRYRSHCSYRYL